MNKFAFCLVSLGVVVLVTGCPSSGPKLVSAEGTITKGGSPLAGASITVQYADQNVAQAVSDAKGAFTLTYMGKNGAVPGSKLRVGVQKVISGYGEMAPPGSSSGPPSQKDIEERMKKGTEMMKEKFKADQAVKGQGGPKNELDAKYATPASSGIELDIPPGGSKTLKIELP